MCTAIPVAPPMIISDVFILGISQDPAEIHSTARGTLDLQFLMSHVMQKME